MLDYHLPYKSKIQNMLTLSFVKDIFTLVIIAWLSAYQRSELLIHMFQLFKHCFYSPIKSTPNTTLMYKLIKSIITPRSFFQFFSLTFVVKIVSGQVRGKSSLNPNQMSWNSIFFFFETRTHVTQAGLELIQGGHILFIFHPPPTF